MGAEGDGGCLPQRPEDPGGGIAGVSSGQGSDKVAERTFPYQYENGDANYSQHECPGEDIPEEEASPSPGKGALSADQIARLNLLKAALARTARGVPLSGPLAESLRRSLRQGRDEPSGGELLGALHGVASQRMGQLSAAQLRTERDRRLQARILQRQRDLQGMEIPEHLSEEMRRSAAVELQALKLVHLQRRVRYEVAAELRLQKLCTAEGAPHQLLDWGLQRLRRSEVAASRARWEVRGAPSAHHVAEVEERHMRKRRKAELRARQEREERAHEALRKARFSAELATAIREISVGTTAAQKRRKQKNDGVLAWHVRQRQRASRAERMRVQALKAGDQEAYLRLVEESKNERLKTLLSKTDDLLQKLGAMVQVQKELTDTSPSQRKRGSRGRPARELIENGEEQEAVEVEEIEGATPTLLAEAVEEGSQFGGELVEEPAGGAELAASDMAEEVAEKKAEVAKGLQQGLAEEEEPVSPLADGGGDAMKFSRDLMEGERRYTQAVHAIEEKVTQQPDMLAGGGQLRDYQLEGLQWMLSLYNNQLNGILADEMGLGKTIQTIALLAYLLEKKGDPGPHMILAPKAVLPNWAHEFATWLPTMRVMLYDGKIEDRKAMREAFLRGAAAAATPGSAGHAGGSAPKPFHVLVTHYDLIMRDKAWLKKVKWQYLVVDEGHRLKNHESMLARTLVAGYHIRRRLLLTGTPIQNSLGELWSLLNFLLPAIFNSNSNFEEWFNAPFADKAEVTLNEEEELLVIRRLHQVIRPFLLRRKKAEVEKYLPQKTQVILKCDLSAWQRAYYSQIVTAGRVGLAHGSGKSRALQNTAMQLRKCCNHPYLFLEELPAPLPRGVPGAQEEDIRRVRSSGKFALLDHILPKLRVTGHRVLLFSQMTRLMDVLEDFLHWRGFPFMRLDGNTRTEERGDLLAAFNAEGSPYFLFLLSTRAGGLGLNLQTADTVILFDSDWNPQMDQQAEDRAHRIGQKKEVRVLVLVSVGSIEEEILERAKTKMGIDAKVIQAGMFNTTSTAQERRDLLEAIMRRGDSTLGSDVPSTREINRLVARSDSEFETFEEMDRQMGVGVGRRTGATLRLMTEEEVPGWVFPREEDTPVAGGEGSADGGGLLGGKRKRSQIAYTDGLTEHQWLKVVEDGEDVEDVLREKQARQKRRKDKANHNSDS